MFAAELGVFAVELGVFAGKSATPRYTMHASAAPRVIAAIATIASVGPKELARWNSLNASM